MTDIEALRLDQRPPRPGRIRQPMCGKGGRGADRPAALRTTPIRPKLREELDSACMPAPLAMCWSMPTASGDYVRYFRWRPLLRVQCAPNAMSLPPKDGGQYMVRPGRVSDRGSAVKRNTEGGTSRRFSGHHYHGPPSRDDASWLPLWYLRPPDLPARICQAGHHERRIIRISVVNNLAGVPSIVYAVIWSGLLPMYFLGGNIDRNVLRGPRSGAHLR